jgi:hypothetical protein
MREEPILEELRPKNWRKSFTEGEKRKVGFTESEQTNRERAGRKVGSDCTKKQKN